jgi:glycerol-3-phosphate dehydrogenase
VDKCIEICRLTPKSGCVTKGLLLDGAHEWSPTLFIRLIQDFGLDMVVSSYCGFLKFL